MCLNHTPQPAGRRGQDLGGCYQEGQAGMRGSSETLKEGSGFGDILKEESLGFDD